MINKYKRYQSGLKVVDLFPIRKDSVCACGCNSQLPKNKKRWFSDNCTKEALNVFWIIKGDVSVIRQNIFERDKGYCRGCGVLSDNWEADHIIPVFKGGGGCGLDNFQTLCYECHKVKSKQKI